MVHSKSQADRAAARRGRLRGAALAASLGPRRRARSTSSSSTTSCDGRRSRGPQNPIGIGWAGPTILYAGTEEQKARYLLPAARRRGDLVPAVQRAGRGQRPRRRSTTRAVRDGDEFVVNGQKIWTIGRPVARSSASSSPAPIRDAPKHRASRTSSARWTRPGIEIRPISEMTGTRARSTRCSSPTCASRPRTSSAT